MVERRQATIITSEVVISEVLEDAAKLEELMKRPEYFMVTPGAPIQRKVRDIRTAAREIGRTPKTPDATFIATALLYKAEALHTFDGPVLGLSGLTCVDGLTICKPSGDQTTLGF